MALDAPLNPNGFCIRIEADKKAVIKDYLTTEINNNKTPIKQ